MNDRERTAAPFKASDSQDGLSKTETSQKRSATKRNLQKATLIKTMTRVYQKQKCLQLIIQYENKGERSKRQIGG